MDEQYDIDAIERHMNSTDMLERLAGMQAGVEALPAIIADLRELRADSAAMREMLGKMRALFDYRVDHGCATATELELICEHDALLRKMGG